MAGRVIDLQIDRAEGIDDHMGIVDGHLALIDGVAHPLQRRGRGSDAAGDGEGTGHGGGQHESRDGGFRDVTAHAGSCRS